MESDSWGKNDERMDGAITTQCVNFLESGESTMYTFNIFNGHILYFDNLKTNLPK